MSWSVATGDKIFSSIGGQVSLIFVAPTGPRTLWTMLTWVLLYASSHPFRYAGLRHTVESDYAKSVIPLYSFWINTQQIRSGHVFQERYKAILVDTDQYLLYLIRYIDLNPDRAGLMKDTVVYSWNSHCAYLGREKLTWISRDLVLSYFAKRVTTARQRYAAFMQKSKGEGHRAEFL